MSDRQEDSASHLSGRTARLEEIVGRFEDAFRRGDRPSIGAYLRGEPGERLSVLRELARAELECRLKAGEPARVEEYLDRYPELARDDDAALELICAESALRRRLEPTLRAEDWLERFPQHRAKLARRLVPETVSLVRDQPSTPARGAPSTEATRATDSPAQGPPAGQPASGESARDDFSRLDRPVRLGKFELLSRIGKGGFGTVYKARDTHLGRLVAIKLPRFAELENDYERERSLREARAAAGLRHPHICPIHEAGEIEDRTYIVMDFIEGTTLDVWASQHQPSAREAAAMAAKIARATHYAHQHGMIHRDIKPANIMVAAETGEPVLTDFGLAKVLAATSQLTQQGDVMGTPAYMAPEQAAGRTDRIGPASDIYSLGAVLYHLACGRPPFEGPASEVLLRVQSEGVPSLRKLKPQVHRDLETICQKAMRGDPASRYATAAELADDLERFNAGESIKARRQGMLARGWRAVARRPWTASLAAALGLAVIVSVALVWSVRDARQTASLIASIQGLIDAGDWSASAVQTIKDLTADLRQRAREEANNVEARTVQRLAAHIETQLALPRPEEMAEALEGNLGLLAEYDEDRAAALRSVLERVVERWAPLASLTPPFTNAADVLGTGQVHSDGDALTCSASSRLVVSRVASAGSVRLEATFQADWEKGVQTELVLDAVSAAAGLPPGGKATPERGYRFVLRAGDLPSEQGAAAALAARPPGKPVVAEIYRGASLLRTKTIDAGLAAGPLRLSAERTGDHLCFGVGTLPTIEFFDPFPVSTDQGVFAIRWPEGGRATEIVFKRRTRAGQPSPLQSGDALYAEGRYQDAIQQYRQQAERYNKEQQVADEALYKQAICWLNLGNDREAERALEEPARRLGTAHGNRWVALAACRLWLLRFHQGAGRTAERDAIFDRLTEAYGADELTALVPNEIHQQIVFVYSQQRTGLNRYRINDETRQALRRRVTATRLFGAAPHANFEIIRGYRELGQEAEALKLSEEIAGALDPWTPGVGFGHIADYCWMLRLAGRRQEAFTVAGRWLTVLHAEGRERSGWPGRTYLFLAEAARVHCSQGSWESAEQIVDAHIMNDGSHLGTDRASFYALRGYLRERRGDTRGAMEAWTEACRGTWLEHGFGLHLLDGLVAGSLSGSLQAEDARRLMNLLAASVSRDSGAKPVFDLMALYVRPETLATACRNAFRTPRGKQSARQLVFRELPFVDCMRVPPLLVFCEIIKEEALPKPCTEDQDAVLWQMADGLYQATLKTGTLDVKRVAPLLLSTWLGVTNVLGWAGVAPKLPPELRGPLAYVMGHRYQRKGLQGAAMFFRTALADAPAGSPLKRLAQAELDRQRSSPAAPSKP